MKSKIIVIIIIFLIFTKISGQDFLKNSPISSTGISVQYGVGNYSVKDEYISKEKYSGVLPLFSIKWVRVHDKYVYKLAMDYSNSSEIKNYNISTNITQFSFNQGFIYPIKKTVFLNRNLFFLMGPSTDLLFFYNKPKIAVSGFDYAQSFAALISASLDSETILQLKPSLQMESSVRISVLSFGMRMVDSEEDDESPAKLLTLFSGLNSSFELGIRYFIFNKISMKFAYISKIIRINAWEPLLSVSDNITFELTCNF